MNLQELIYELNLLCTMRHCTFTDPNEAGTYVPEILRPKIQSLKPELPEEYQRELNPVLDKITDQRRVTPEDVSELNKIITQIEEKLNNRG